jgi:hypothetical protein
MFPLHTLYKYLRPTYSSRSAGREREPGRQPGGYRWHGEAGHARDVLQVRDVRHVRDVVADALGEALDLDVLHHRAQAREAAAKRADSLWVWRLRDVLRTIVERLLRLAPVAALREIRLEQGRVDPAEVILRNVGLEDLGREEEDLAELAQELETLAEGWDAECADGVLVRLDVPVEMAP